VSDPVKTFPPDHVSEPSKTFERLMLEGLCRVEEGNLRDHARRLRAQAVDLLHTRVHARELPGFSNDVALMRRVLDLLERAEGWKDT